jgi:AcrR family transcriptional regulator
MHRAGIAPADKTTRVSGMSARRERVETPSRKAQTREALLMAFRDLFFEHGYEAIRVGDIISRAGVGRSTFYEHYRSKHALYADSLQRTASRLAIIADATTTVGDLIPLFEHFWEMRGKSRRLHNAVARRQLVRTLAGMLQQRLPTWSSGEADPARCAFLAFGLANMLVGTIVAWQAGDLDCRPAVFARELRAVVVAAVASLKDRA